MCLSVSMRQTNNDELYKQTNKSEEHSRRRSVSFFSLSFSVAYVCVCVCECVCVRVCRMRVADDVNIDVVLQCAVVCCSVLQYVKVCCREMQCVAV